MNHLLRKRNEYFSALLNQDINYHQREEVSKEASVLKRAIKMFSERYQYRYLIAYEYEHPSFYKGDAILAKLNYNGTIDLLAVEAKWCNYDAKWRNQKEKLKTLKKQVADYEEHALHYLESYVPELNANLINEIQSVGVYNDEQEEIQTIGSISTTKSVQSNNRYLQNVKSKPEGFNCMIIVIAVAIFIFLCAFFILTALSTLRI